jgi:hypothetical protein
MRTYTPRPGITLLMLLIAALASGCGGGGGGGSSQPSGTAPPPVTSPPDPAPDPIPDPTPDAPVFKPVPIYEQEYESLFSLDSVKTVRIRITEDEWNGLLNDVDNNLRSEIYRRADFYYGDQIATAKYVPSVGFRIRGNFTSRKRPEVGRGNHDPDNDLVRVHFKIKFNEKFDDDESAYGPPSQDLSEKPGNKGRTFRGVRGLNLRFNKNDPSYMRELVSYDLFRRVGVHTWRQAYAKFYLQIGSEPERYMGVYLMSENIDKVWAERRFGENSYLFKSLYQQFGPADLSRGDRDHNADTGAIGEEITDPEFYGDPWDDYRPAYDLKTKDDEFLEAEDKLNDLIELLTGNPTQAQLEAAINIPALLRAQAVNVFVGMWDDYWRNGNNYYLFWDEITEQWFFVPYDYDITFFDSIFGVNGVASASFMRWGAGGLSGNPVLMDKVLAYPKFRELYADYVRALTDPDEEILDIATITERMEGLRTLIEPHTSGYEAVDEFPYRSSHFQILEFIDERTTQSRRELGK